MLKLVGVSNIAWSMLLSDIIKETSHNPTRTLDENDQKFSDFAKFLIVLNEFKNQKASNPLTSLIESSSTLEHLFFSFLLIAPASMIFKILELTPVTVISAKTKKERVAYISGTLGAWKQTVITLSNENYEARLIAKELLNVFFGLGLQFIFSNYTKVDLKDGTLRLEYTK